MKTKSKKFRRINWLVVCTFFFALMVASCSKDTVTDEPDTPPVRFGEIPEWVKETGVFISDMSRGVEGYAIMYELSAKAKSIYNLSQATEAFGGVTVVFSEGGKVHIWGLVDLAPCERWIDGHISEDGSRIVLDPVTYIYGKEDGDAWCKVLQVRVNQQGVYDMLENEPMAFRFTEGHDLVYEKPSGCADGDICSFAMNVSAAAVSFTGMKESGNVMRIYDGAVLNIRRPQLIRNAGELNWEKTEMSFTNNRSKIQKEVEYAYDGDNFYLRIDDNIMVGRIEGNSVVFRSHQCTSPGLDASPLRDLFGMGINRQYLCMENSAHTILRPVGGDITFKYKYEVERIDDGNPATPVEIHTFPALELVYDQYWDDGICFRNGSDYYDAIYPEKIYGHPIIGNINNFPAISFEFEDPFDPYIAGDWTRQTWVGGHTCYNTYLHFGETGDFNIYDNFYKVHYKGSWKTEQGYLFMEYRQDETKENQTIDEKTHNDTMRYRLPDGTICLDGTFLIDFTKSK